MSGSREPAGGPLPVAVVGAGNMGGNHVRVYSELDGVELVEVVEPDDERAAAVTERYDVEVRSHHTELTEAEAATVAVPNHHHREVAVDCIERGLDVLVEKPLALDVDDARAIRDAAERTDRVLGVGHVERYNPAVEVLGEIVADRDVIAVEAHRLGPFNESLSEESVIFDLMIHDIDVIRSLVDGEVTSLGALGNKPRSGYLDYVVSQFKFDSGIIGSVTASHVTHGKVRTLEVTTRDLYVTLDYQRQDVKVQRRGTTESTSLLNEEHRIETLVETPYVRTREPLKNELEDFVDCVRRRATPRVDGTDGVEAVAFATEIADRVTD